MRNRSLLAVILLAAIAFACAQTAHQFQAIRAHAQLASANESALEQAFLAVPSAHLAGEELRILTAQPHVAGTPEDHATALYVASKFREAGLETQIVPYRVLLNWPKVVRVQAYDAAGKLLMTGPTREHVSHDPYQDNPRIIMPFNGSSGSGDVTAPVVYANYGRLQDFNKLAAEHIDLHGKIVIVRYGANFRGVKVYLAEQRGAVGVLIYSDPQDDGYYRGDPYPNGPWRPATGVQRGSVQYLFKYPGDPETPGFASTPNLPDSRRMDPYGNQPHIISIPLSYHDAAPILQALKGPDVPQGWQGALPFRYHIGGAGAVRVHLVSKQDYERRLIWDVIGKIKGSQFPDEWVIAGNHRDAWTFGAVDPNSGTAAMLEAVHGLGALLRQGWRPKRTIIFCSWDAEEEGLIGSTEWVEQNGALMSHAVAYFNTDVGVSGPDFGAAAVPSLKQFIRNVAKAVPSPLGGTVYEQWRLHQTEDENRRSNAPAEPGTDVRVADLGSGSDFTPFLQHAGVPSTDIGSHGPYGVYHSAFDDYAWFVMNADPHFLYEQEMARIFGLEALRMADDPVLPYDYEAYAAAIGRYLEAASRKAADTGYSSLDFSQAKAADARFAAAARKMHTLDRNPLADPAALNQHLRDVELDLLSPAGLPNRTWFKHTIYAPGEYTGYSAVVIPGVNEAIDAKQPEVAQQQLTVLAQALDRAAQTLDSAP
jgi:N-acetylated-alpha-linked acidic dipeptidase